MRTIGKNLCAFFVYLLYTISLPAESFNPFSDDELFAIHWAGPSDLGQIKKAQGDIEIVSVKTEDNEQYHCIIPESQASIDATKKATYNGASPDELIEALFFQTACSYRIESYWTYELCHGKHIRQYHENKELSPQKVKSQEYFLGRINPLSKSKPSTPPVVIDENEEDIDADADDQGETTTQTPHTQKQEKHEQEIKSIKLDGLDLPYYYVEMDGGTECDLNGKPRKSHVMYICQPNGRGEIYQLKETSTCEYDIIVLTAVLCNHPSFKPKDPPVSKINCHSGTGSPHQPRRLTQLQNERGIKLEPEDDDLSLDAVEIKVKPAPPRSHPVPPKYATPKATTPKPNIGTQADKSLLRDFLSGDYCIHGGGGWWKHEFCYNKYAKQYHEDQTGTTDIYLGKWDPKKHLAWLRENPGKKPKPPGNRKHISLFYSGGDICDLTNKPRHVEVKLKCLAKTDQPHAVSIYLIEPEPCNYVLGVESPLFCDIIDKADNNGLFDHIKV